jgi:hypothetical protein
MSTPKASRRIDRPSTLIDVSAENLYEQATKTTDISSKQEHSRTGGETGHLGLDPLHNDSRPDRLRSRVLRWSLESAGRYSRTSCGCVTAADS